VFFEWTFDWFCVDVYVFVKKVVFDGFYVPEELMKALSVFFNVFGLPATCQKEKEVEISR